MTKAVVIMKRKMSLCVFLASLKLKLSSFHWGGGLVIRPQFPGSQKHFAAISEFCKDTHRTYYIILWEMMSSECSVMFTTIPVATLIKAKFTVRWFHRKKWKVAFSFQKINNNNKKKTLTKSVVMMRKMNHNFFFCRFDAAIIQFPKVEDRIFTIRAQFLCSQNQVSWQLQSCVKTQLLHTSISWKKMSGESVLWLFTAKPIVTLIRWNSILYDFKARIQSILLMSENKNHYQSWCSNSKKHESVCFSGKFMIAYIQLLTGGNFFFFLAISPNSQVHKNTFHCSFRSV